MTFLGPLNTKALLTAHDDHVGRKLRILSSLCERLDNYYCSFRKTDKIGGVRGKRKKILRLAYKIPPFLLDRTCLAFCDDGPHELWNAYGIVECKVERHFVFGSIEEVDEAPGDLDGELKEIVARS